jgi:hypothetical protein
MYAVDLLDHCSILNWLDMYSSDVPRPWLTIRKEREETLMFWQLC